jgi:hypothetical protein
VCRAWSLAERAAGVAHRLEDRCPIRPELGVLRPGREQPIEVPKRGLLSPQGPAARGALGGPARQVIGSRQPAGHFEIRRGPVESAGVGVDASAPRIKQRVPGLNGD